MTQATYAKMEESDYLALAHQYPGQNSPCRVYLYLDLRDGAVTVDWDAEAGNAVSEAEWNGRIRSWGMSQVITPRLANEIVEEAMPHLQAILDDSEIDWDGSNHVGVMGEAAMAASAEIENIITSAVKDSPAEWVVFYDANMWYENISTADMGITAETTDEEIARMAADDAETAACHDDGINGACVSLDVDDVEAEMQKRRDALMEDAD